MNKHALTIIGVITVFLVATNAYAENCTKADLFKAVDYTAGLINTKGKSF